MHFQSNSPTLNLTSHQYWNIIINHHGTQSNYDLLAPVRITELLIRSQSWVIIGFTGSPNIDFYSTKWWCCCWKQITKLVKGEQLGQVIFGGEKKSFPKKFHSQLFSSVLLNTVCRKMHDCGKKAVMLNPAYNVSILGYQLHLCTKTLIYRVRISDFCPILKEWIMFELNQCRSKSHAGQNYFMLQDYLGLFFYLDSSFLILEFFAYY